MHFAGDYQQPERMMVKLAAVPLPADLTGKSVLDVGCDHGFWSELAAQRGAARVLGLDRGREVRGRGFVDLPAENRERIKAPACRFARIEIGRQWHDFAAAMPGFDLVLVLSVYHHIYEQAGGDHAPIWYWLWEQIAEDGTLIWEGPTGIEDHVVARNVSQEHRGGYTRDRILAAARNWFDVEIVGPALHEPTREVWRCRPKAPRESVVVAELRAGAGGATPAFLYADGRRMDEIEQVLGWRPYPGSLNLALAEPFDWDSGYFRSKVLDVVDRKAGLASEWAPRWARFYPVLINRLEAVAFRFEGERYPATMVELVAPLRLRDHITEPVAFLGRRL